MAHRLLLKYHFEFKLKHQQNPKRRFLESVEIIYTCQWLSVDCVSLVSDELIFFLIGKYSGNHGLRILFLVETAISSKGNRIYLVDLASV